jgi:succinyl-diaminopimelate desuccinylase
MGGHVDPLELSRALIRCPSITPNEAGALTLLQAELERLGFGCDRLVFAEAGSPPVENLFARIGDGRPHFCFAGHADVVPVGDPAAWTTDPFAAEIRDGRLYGRGAADMKAAIACFVAAAARFLGDRGGRFGGSLSLLITGDEEGPAVNGTVKVLAWLAGQGVSLDDCLVGEPTNPQELGEMVKIGRRGSLNAVLTVAGVQGHAAYPHLADNPIPRLLRMLAAAGETALDHGTAEFDPSHLTITSIDVGNPAPNLIPGTATARLNIRFNDLHDCADLRRWLEQRCRSVDERFRLEAECSGEAFLTRPGRLRSIVVDAIQRQIGRSPRLGTGGGTSDARFFKDFCPVVEFGMAAETAHKVDENVRLDDIPRLVGVYAAVLDSYFPGNG